MRYLGNKTDLLQDIGNIIKENKLEHCSSFCDAFTGTCSVGNYFKNDFTIIANDVMFFSYCLAQAKLNPPKQENIKDYFKEFNDNVLLDNYIKTSNKENFFIYNNYSPNGNRQYFSNENALKIDFIRQQLEKDKKNKRINDNEYYYLIACLLESVSKVSNIAGVYGAYLKIWDSRAIKPMKFLNMEESLRGDIKHNIYNETIENLIEKIQGDILYLDPPYTKQQYSSQYHLLETIAKYDEPIIKGITGNRQDNIKSAFSKEKDGECQIAFENIIAKADFKYIITSYSSAGIMSKDFIEDVLKRYGELSSYDFKKIGYKKYQNKRTNEDKENFEYLFFIKKKEKNKIYFQSPLNYIGGKFEMIDFIKQNAPKKIDTLIDLFGGGFNVGINFNCKNIIYNDINFKVKELLELFKNNDTYKLYADLKKLITKYNLQNGNKESYVKLRQEYNKNKDNKLLYLLVLYGFQHQIRFNSNLEFNNPVGTSGFNEKNLEKFITFSREIKEKNILWMAKYFTDLSNYINKNSFFYCDPPYLITLGSYNDGKRGFNGWNEKDELKLYDFLDLIDKKDSKFMLSNVLKHKGKENNILKDWITKNNYKVMEYNGKREEIIVINY